MGVTTTPQEPSSEPDLVPSGDQPLGPIEVPENEPDPDPEPVPDSGRVAE
jgi:hypothetical protein